MTITLKVNSTRTSWYAATVDPAIRDTERYMANLIRKAKIHKPVITCRHPLDPHPAYAVALGSPVFDEIPGLHCNTALLSYLSDYSPVILWVDGHPSNR
jgi:hypothetical protein